MPDVRQKDLPVVFRDCTTAITLGTVEGVFSMRNLVTATITATWIICETSIPAVFPIFRLMAVPLGQQMTFTFQKARQYSLISSHNSLYRFGAYKIRSLVSRSISTNVSARFKMAQQFFFVLLLLIPSILALPIAPTLAPNQNAILSENILGSLGSFANEIGADLPVASPQDASAREGLGISSALLDFGSEMASLFGNQ
jgi:hypothetical protein